MRRLTAQVVWIWLKNMMDEWKHRRAEHADIPAIMEIIRQAQEFIKTLGIDQWQDGYPDVQRFQEDIDLGQCYIFHDADTLAGVVVVAFFPEKCYEAIEGPGWLSCPDSYAVIHRMAVSAASRGGGLAGEMIVFAEQLCKAGHVRSLRIDTHRGNIPMQKFLSKNHFAYCGNVDYGLTRGDSVRMAYEKVIMEMQEGCTACLL